MLLFPENVHASCFFYQAGTLNEYVLFFKKADSHIFTTFNSDFKINPMKKILYIVIGLLAVYLILCLAGPSSMKIERSTEINAPADEIRTKITDLKFFHESWSPWTEKDPAMQVTYTGEAGKEGHSMSWISDNKEVGKGSMTYRYTHNDTVMQTLHFDGQGDAQVYHVVSATGDNKSKVTWIMQNHVPFFFRAIMLFMNIDKMVGPDFEKGLSKLKTAIESIPAEPAAVSMTYRN
jgi:hypothetical protein